MSRAGKVTTPALHMVVRGNLLVITVNLDAPTVQSASGKSEVIASTRGNTEVEGASGVMVGLNVYRRVK